jgi:capsular exopolysaccharide synthesis family protein
VNEDTLRDYIRVLFRQKAVIIVTIITVILTVAIGLMLKTPVYEATVKMLISSEKEISSPFAREMYYGAQNISAVLTQSEIVKSRPVLEKTVRALGLQAKPLDYEKNFASPIKQKVIDYTVKGYEKEMSELKPDQKKALLYRLAVRDLNESIKVEPIRDTDVFTITVKDYSPIGSAIIANVVSRAYVIFDLEQQLSDMQMKYGEKNLAVTQMRDSIEKMTKSLNGEPLPDVEAIGPASVKIIEQANVPLKPSGIPKILMLVLAIAMSVFLGVMLAFMFEYLAQEFKSPKEIESYLNLTCLGSIRRKPKKDDYHAIADEIFLELKDKKLKSVMVTSAEGREGVTTIVAGIGRCLSEVSGHKTLLIDANLRRARLHEAFKIQNTAGLGNILEDKAAFDQSVKEISPKLSILTAGNTALNPMVLFDSHKMGELLKTVKGKYETVIIDAPRLGLHKDSELIAAVSDSVCLVISETGVRRQAAKIAIEPLVEKKSYILGAILNKRTFPIPKWLYERV